MKEVPQRVKESFERMRKEYDSYIELKHLNSRFCVFEATSKWDPSMERPRKVTRYLGWFTDDGFFVPARRREKPEGLKAVERAYMQKINEVEKEGSEVNVEANNASQHKLDDSDMKLLTALSMNARMPYNKMQEITGINESSIPYRIKRLEQQLGIKYTIEADMSKLGFFDYMILAKFHGGKPSDEDIKKAVEPEARVQLAMSTKGDYDLVMMCLVEGSEAIIYLLNRIRKNEALSGIDSEWYITPTALDYNYVPLRNEFLELLESKVWHRKRGGKRPSSTDLMYREYAVLKELNSDSTKSFASIDEKYDLPKGSAKAAYEKLISEDSGVIIRPTINATKLNYRYYAMILADIINKSEFLKTKGEYRKYIINEQIKLINRFSYITDFETPNSILFISPITENGQLDNLITDLKSKVKGIKLNYLIVSDILLGSLLNRRFDNLYSLQYEYLVKTKSVESKERIKYK